MPIRLAITVAGAVSLGPYEAGVLFDQAVVLAGHPVGLVLEDPRGGRRQHVRPDDQANRQGQEDGDDRDQVISEVDHKASRSRTAR